MRTYSSPTKISWGCMKQRCDYKGACNYPRYGGRGITYDPRWAKFHNFLSDMGERPRGYTLERKDNNGNYTKDNCVWAPTKQQQNNKSTTRHLTILGKTMSIKAWANHLGISAQLIHSRLKIGWSHLDCICPDSSKRHRNSKRWGY